MNIVYEITRYIWQKADAKIPIDKRAKMCPSSNQFYGKLKEEIIKVVESEPWTDFLSEHNFQNFLMPTQDSVNQDIKEMLATRPLPWSDFDIKNAEIVFRSALRDLIDAYEENSELCQKIRVYHKFLLGYINSHINSDFPTEFDSDTLFNELIVSRSHRQLRREARHTGSVCIHCGSTNVHSKGLEWKCLDCGKRFRKH